MFIKKFTEILDRCLLFYLFIFNYIYININFLINKIIKHCIAISVIILVDSLEHH